MSHYKSNLRDIEFNLFEVFGRDQVLGRGLPAGGCAQGVDHVGIGSDFDGIDSVL